MSQESITALKKLIGHCGIKFRETIKLEKKDFDLKQKIILVRAETSKIRHDRLATIRPYDIDWFNQLVRTKHK